jgi:hypothetical protein
VNSKLSGAVDPPQPKPYRLTSPVRVSTKQVPVVTCPRWLRARTSTCQPSRDCSKLPVHSTV